MMRIQVKLYGILRDQLPAAQKGETELELPEGADIQSLLNQLKISRRVEVAINEDIETEYVHVLKEGDQVHIFTAVGGG
ncbi:MAG: MoaD/ThiS family protein [Chloroflexota bacterium]